MPTPPDFSFSPEDSTILSILLFGLALTLAGMWLAEWIDSAALFWHDVKRDVAELRKTRGRKRWWMIVLLFGVLAAPARGEINRISVPPPAPAADFHFVSAGAAINAAIRIVDAANTFHMMRDRYPACPPGATCFYGPPVHSSDITLGPNRPIATVLVLAGIPGERLTTWWLLKHHHRKLAKINPYLWAAPSAIGIAYGRFR